jgi:hypothetical protein
MIAKMLQEPRWREVKVRALCHNRAVAETERVEVVRLIFNTSKRQGVDCKRQSALKKRLGTTSWLLGGLGSVLGELPDGGRQSDAGGA